MSHTPEQIRQLLQQGESQTVEFKLNIKEPSMLANLIASFANSRGGTIIVGVEDTATIKGCDPKQAERVYTSAIHQLSTTPTTSIEFVDVDGKVIALISIEKSNGLVLSREGAFQRIGASIQPMSPANIASALEPHEPSLTKQESIAKGIAELTVMVRDLQQQLEQANSFKGQIRNYLVGGVIGAILGLILTVIFT